MCSAPETCSHFGPRLTSSHFCSVMLIASRRSPGFMRALAAAEPGSIDLAIIPCEVSTQATPSVGGPWLCHRCQKLIAPATNKSAAVASSSHVLVVSTEPFILLSFREVNHAHSSHTLRHLPLGNRCSSRTQTNLSAYLTSFSTLSPFPGATDRVG